MPDKHLQKHAGSQQRKQKCGEMRGEKPTRRFLFRNRSGRIWKSLRSKRTAAPHLVVNGTTFLDLEFYRPCKLHAEFLLTLCQFSFIRTWKSVEKKFIYQKSSFEHYHMRFAGRLNDAPHHTQLFLPELLASFTGFWSWVTSVAVERQRRNKTGSVKFGW